ncbi:MAG: hypothetical protein LBL66_00160 [Clostridiales bacterium]|jgi:hypothetical protein|nr:hypothetical protein [Clostridiales bacterium]
MKEIFRNSGEILYELPVFMNGVLRIRASGAAREIVCSCGPFRDFIIFRHSLTETREGAAFVYTAKRLLTARYIRIECADTRGVTAAFEEILFPGKPVGRFRCEDPLLTRVYETSARTVERCILPHRFGNSSIEFQSETSRRFAAEWRGAQDDWVIMDGARRDREVWVGDLLYECRTAWYVYGDGGIIKNTFAAILDQIDGCGNIAASSISMQTFYEYNCWFIIVFYEYVRMSGDRAYWLEQKDVLIRILNRIVDLTGGGPLVLGRRQTWAWTSGRSGALTGSNCVYYKALLCMAELLESGSAAEKYGSLARALKAEIRKAFDEKGQCYLDAIGGERYALDACALAVCFGVSEGEEARRVLASVKAKFRSKAGFLLFSPKEEPDGQNWVHNDHVWPFVNTILLEAFLKCSLFADAYELIAGVWGGMLDKGAETFWEIIDGDTGGFMPRRLTERSDDCDTWNSECHGWSAGLPQLIAEYVLGVKPAASAGGRPVCAPVYGGDFSLTLPVEQDVWEITREKGRIRYKKLGKPNEGSLA